MRAILILLTIISVSSCRTDSEESSNEMTNHFKVEYAGALKDMMHKGDISAKAELSELAEAEHLYALGALENLKGEIQIFDSKPYNTIVSDSLLAFDHSFDKKATLLVYASVSNWTSISIPDSIITYQQLESYIAQSAEEHQIEMDNPFPFLLAGTPQSFDWHVINWKEGDTDHSHAKHIRSGLHGTINNREVTMLGFYSDSHHAIFTHHTTNMHIHVKTVDNKLAGHLDDLTLGKGMILKLPNLN